MKPNRIDVHQHLLPPHYTQWLRTRGIADAGGRALPDWSAETALAMMDDVGTATAILSLSAPGTTPADSDGEAVSMAREVNYYAADLVKQHPDRFGFFATLPMPHLKATTDEAVRALDDLGADGVTLLANAAGRYVGQPEDDPLFAALDERGAVVFIHPAELPDPTVAGVPPFATDFLLDTTRAAYLLVRHGVVRRYPRIRFILSHAGGFVPYAAHRMAVSIVAETGRSPLEVLEDLRSFYFDTALSGSPAALPSLLAFARPEHVLFGSDWPFAPATAVHYFTAGLDNYVGALASGRAINRDNAAALFPQRATPQPAAVGRRPFTDAKGALKRRIVRAAVKLVDPARS
jgi:6-methylsalicylate decarboxylase